MSPLFSQTATLSSILTNPALAIGLSPTKPNWKPSSCGSVLRLGLGYGSRSSIADWDHFFFRC